MKTKERTINNIQSAGYRLGKAIKGKGTEILSCVTTLVSMWNMKKEENINKLCELIDNAKIDELFIAELMYDDEREDLRAANLKNGQAQINLKDLVVSRFAGIRGIVIKQDPQEILGYISLSKYRSDIESQKQLIVDLLALEGIKVEYQLSEYRDDIFDENVHEDIKSTKYEMVHGDNRFVLDKDNSEYVDGKPYYHNSMVVGEFWDFEYEDCLKPHLKEIDPKQEIVIYHRKGKDWYVAPALKEMEFHLSYFCETYNEEENDIFYALVYKDNAELVEKAKNILKSYRDDLSAKSYIYNEMETGECFDVDYHNDGIVNHALVELIYGDKKDDLVQTIVDSIQDWDNITPEFARIYHEEVNSRMSVKDDLKVEITAITEKIFAFNHLKILKALEKRFGYQIVQSIILGTSNMAWALRKDGEEYHFDIAEIIMDDINEKTSLREFITNALAALTKRKLERLSQAELYEKASHVFVGIEDSLLSGNCSYGTTQFIAKHQIDTNKIGGLRGDVLLQMEDSSFTKRAVMHAISSHGGVAC